MAALWPWAHPAPKEAAATTFVPDCLSSPRKAGMGLLCLTGSKAGSGLGGME